MKALLSIILCFSASLVFGQMLKFSPKWTAGTTKTILLKTTQKDFEFGDLKNDTSYTNKAIFKVLEEQETAYIAEVVFENQLLIAAKEFYEKIGEELTDYQNITLRISVDKNSGDYRVLNPEQCRDFYLNSLNQITKVLEEKAPEMAAMSNYIFTTFSSMFDNEENIQAYAKEYIGFIFIPFQMEYSLTDTLANTETTESPFDPSKTVSSTIYSSISKSNKVDHYIIEQKVELDLSEMKTMMVQMMQGMAASMGISDSSVVATASQIDSMELNMENVQSIDYNSKTTWVEHVTHTSTVYSMGNKTEVIVEFVFK